MINIIFHTLEHFSMTKRGGGQNNNKHMHYNHRKITKNLLELFFSNFKMFGRLLFQATIGTNSTVSTLLQLSISLTLPKVTPLFIIKLSVILLKDCIPFIHKDCMGITYYFSAAGSSTLLEITKILSLLIVQAVSH